ncbi:MAG: hypothetical protein K9J13_05635 [Saprospiraceae bacterium]|nr:hypothetical protein [Saprospiraceae bacterium]
MKALLTVVLIVLFLNATAQDYETALVNYRSKTFRVLNTDYNSQCRFRWTNTLNTKRLFGGVGINSTILNYGTEIRYYQPDMFNLNLSYSRLFTPKLQDQSEFGISGILYVIKKSKRDTFKWVLKRKYNWSGADHLYDLFYTKVPSVQRMIYIGPHLSAINSINAFKVSTVNEIDDVSFATSLNLGFGLGVNWGRHIESQFKKKRKEPKRRQTYMREVNADVILFLNPSLDKMVDPSFGAINTLPTGLSKVGFAIEFIQSAPYRTTCEFGMTFRYKIYSCIDGSAGFGFGIGYYLGN